MECLLLASHLTSHPSEERLMSVPVCLNASVPSAVCGRAFVLSLASRHLWFVQMGWLDNQTLNKASWPADESIEHPRHASRLLAPHL